MPFHCRSPHSWSPESWVMDPLIKAHISHVVEARTKQKPWRIPLLFSILHFFSLVNWILRVDFRDITWCKIVSHFGYKRSTYQFWNSNGNSKTIHGPRILDCPQRKTDSKAAWKARDIASANLEGCLKAVHSIIASVKFMFGYCRHNIAILELNHSR